MANCRFVALLLFFAMTIALSGIPTSSAADMREWLVIQLEGTVEVQRNDSTWRRLRPGDTVIPGDEIRTGQNAKVRLSRGTESIAFEPNSVLTFLSGDSHVTRIFQMIGGAFYDIGKGNRKHFEVRTPKLVATVKGTEFSIKSDPDKAILSVKSGIVGVTNKYSGRSIDVSSGQFVRISANSGAIAIGASVARSTGSAGLYWAIIAIVSAVLCACLIVYVTTLRNQSRLSSSAKTAKRSIDR